MEQYLSKIKELNSETSSNTLTAGFPTKKLEDWHFTSLKTLNETYFEPTPPLIKNASELLTKSTINSHKLVFVGGVLDKNLSSPMPKNCKISTLKISDNPKTSLNAFNAVFAKNEVKISINSTVTTPIELIHINGGNNSINPRISIETIEGITATIIENYIGENTAYWHNTVTFIKLKKGTTLTHYRLQNEGNKAVHTGLTKVKIASATTYNLFTLQRGATLARNSINIDILGENSSCNINSIAIATEKQHLDTTTNVIHHAPNSTSNENFRHMAGGSATAVFQGKFHIMPEAQKTDAKMMCKNLLLSKNATCNTKPELEVLADDVKCTHGTTVGSLDSEAMFYLQSRGISKEKAEKMLTSGFISEVLEYIPDAEIKQYFEEVITGA